MTNPTRIPSKEQLNREADLLRRLIEHPPWKRVYAPFEIDTAVRAAFRRWSPAEEKPSLLMLHAIWDRLGEQERKWLESLPQDLRDDAASRIARTLHLFALAADEGPALASFGAACAYIPPKSKQAIISTKRFARLVNSPPEVKLRLEALGRACRYFRQKGVRVQSADADNMMIFLFGANPKRVTSRWANDYFSRATADDSTTTAVEADVN